MECPIQILYSLGQQYAQRVSGIHIRIDRQLIRTRERGIVEAPTKTNNVRYLKIPDETIALLQEYREEQDRWRQINADRWVETEYVLTKENGEGINPESLTAWLAEFSERHGLPHIHPYMLRHTGASICIENGVDVATVSEALGHGDIATTMGTYIHAVKAAQAKAAGCISSVMYESGRKKDKN